MRTDVGQAIALAAAGRSLYDEGHRFVRHEELSARDFGLEEDIGEINFPEPEEGSGIVSDFFRRTYHFEIYQRGEHVHLVTASISLAKETERSEWEVVYEGLIDQRRPSAERYVISRGRLKEG